MHGGVYYIRRTQLARDVFALARQICEDFYSFSFLGPITPTDETALALAMSVKNCPPTEETATPKKSPYIVFLPSILDCIGNRIKLDFPKSVAHIKKNGLESDVLLVHFQTNYTVDGLYQSQVYLMNCLRAKNGAPISAHEEASMYNTARRMLYIREPRRILRRTCFLIRHRILGGLKRGLRSAIHRR